MYSFLFVSTTKTVNLYISLSCWILSLLASQKTLINHSVQNPGSWNSSRSGLRLLLFNFVHFHSQNHLYRCVCLHQTSLLLTRMEGKTIVIHLLVYFSLLFNKSDPFHTSYWWNGLRFGQYLWCAWCNVETDVGGENLLVLTCEETTDCWEKKSITQCAFP